MKSKYFGQWDPLAKRNEEFVQDVKFVNDLPPDIRLTLANHAAGYGLARTTPEERVIADKMATETGLLPVQAARVLRLYYFLERQMSLGAPAADDTPTALADDLLELNLISKDQHAATVVWLERLKQCAIEQLFTGLRTCRATQSSMPFVEDIEFTANFRAVFDKDFEPTKSDIALFDPQCIGVEPVAIIKLELFGASTKYISFQADRRAIGLIIQHLQAAGKSLDKAASYLSLKKKG